MTSPPDPQARPVPHASPSKHHGHAHGLFHAHSSSSTHAIHIPFLPRKQSSHDQLASTPTAGPSTGGSVFSPGTHVSRSPRTSLSGPAPSSGHAERGAAPGPPPERDSKLLRTRSKGKEKEPDKDKEQDARRRIREVGSATISLRAGVVQRLVDDDEEDGSQGHHRRGTLLGTRPQPPLRFSSSNIKSTTIKSVRKTRSNSLHFPAPGPTVDRSFYLPHFSTDAQYSLKPRTESGLPLELGLGGDFDVSFGEAMRRGTGSEEMPLPREALRVLSEAKENLGLASGAKQGRKGSMGMGLFKESRVAAELKKGKDREDRRESAIVEADPDDGQNGPAPITLINKDPRSRSRTVTNPSRPALVTSAHTGSALSLRSQHLPSSEEVSPSSSVPSTPVPIRGLSRRRQELIDQATDDEGNVPVGLAISSPLFRSSPDRVISPPRVEDDDDEVEEEDSGWTTTSTESLSEEDDNRWSDGGREDEASGQDEAFTVPLQPFNHAVGGHSSIYKFTRRAVCKPLVSRENLFYEEVERLAPALLAFIPRYLGVMMVNYRRQMPPPTELSMTPRDSPSVANSPAPSHPSTPGATAMRPSVSKHSTGLSAYSSMSVASGVEIPEVSLDYNRHVVPDWLFRRDDRRGRAGHPSGTSDEDSSRKTLRPSSARSQEHMRFNSHSPASSWQSSMFGASPLLPPGSPAIPRPIQERDEPSTPAPSPSTSYLQKHLHHTVSSPSLPSRMNRDLSHSHNLSDMGGSRDGYSTPQPFGGTGSTTVNTKLKDHVFATILKRLRKKGFHAHRHEDEADDEGDERRSLRGGRRYRRGLSRGEHDGGSVDLRGSFGDSEDGIRRTKSDVVLTERRYKRDESLERGMFEMEEVSEEEDGLAMTRKDRVPLGNGLHPMTAVNKPVESPSEVSQPSPQPARPSVPPSPSMHPDETARQELFIFMEDLTGRLKHPCVLDLKMGTRQYGYDATPMKKKSQRKKCDTTTSRTLGVWNNDTQSFESRNKYRGREVKTSDFPDILRSYLSDGNTLLVDHIPVIVQKLHNLAAIMLQLDGFRFYGCSLLLIYDGDKETQDHYRQHVRGESRPQEDDEWAEHRHRPIRREAIEHGEERRSRSVDHSRPRSTQRPSSVGTRANSHARGCAQGHHRKIRGNVNIRVVDFAHTTTGRDFVKFPPGHVDPPDSVLGKGYDTKVDPSTGLTMARFPPKHMDKPDMGFVFGLKSVCEALTGIYEGQGLRMVVGENGEVFDRAFADANDADLST
ncbi:hypothetical protein IAU60_002527 [Kwoniella sp. DSM 27419]